ncbi:diguanylate cyclase (GGDEF)-like protein [Pseudomonas duriflava]|uniref:cyclic-guanylate-specific phosphodiesterase n=1 Tax=Pseudomonas duriflava TaxID=459528 RepID=A0A562Q7F2_9PSED|nr:EAL domain-containing protein [Pseudomonas duriflava]TWI52692.1 diguanylate cyclase (GGDEF)-like protein [Pseudomonas duriflava]
MDWLGIRFISDLYGAGLTPVEYSHTAALVIISYVIASVAGYATLSLADVAIADTHRSRILWRLIGAFCLGGGVWTMHFLAMQAFQLPVTVSYDHRLTAISLFISVIAALIAMTLISRPALTRHNYIGAGICVGIGVAVMHYTGMAAMRSIAVAYYNPWLFLFSIVLSLVVSLGAMLLIKRFRKPDQPFPFLLKLLASLALGAAIISIHFSGMAAVTFTLPATPPVPSPEYASTTQTYLGISTAFIALIITGCSLIAVWAGRKLERQRLDLERVNKLLLELDNTQASLHNLAHYDALTGLHNRHSFNTEIQKRMDAHRQAGTPMLLLFLDMDNFKRINDSLGHDAGDELLRVVAHRLRSALREQDMSARLGGDEFCVLAHVSDSQEAAQLAQRILTKMKEAIVLAGRKMVVTTSIGASIFPQDGDTAEDLIKHADLALYKSKASGRNTVHFFQEQLKSKAMQELQIEEELRYALTHDGLTLHYQPVFDLKTRAICHLEALVRWNHPEQGLLLPGHFIDIATNNGFIVDIDRWAMQRACSDLKKLHRLGFTQLRMAVNCCASSLERESLVSEVKQILSDAQLEPRYLELEVTENALMKNVDHCIAQLEQLRSLGIRLAIDDFGTGYSSLAYLRQLPLDAIKVDRSFIQDIPQDVLDFDIAQAIIAMGHKLRLQVIAEGVETEQQVSFLMDNQCDLAQGFLPSRPLPLEALTALLQKKVVNDFQTFKSA